MQTVVPVPATKTVQDEMLEATVAVSRLIADGQPDERSRPSPAARTYMAARWRTAQLQRV